MFFENDGLLFGEDALGGFESLEKVKNIQKSLGVDYTMGVTDQTGGAAVRLQSLANTLKIVEANEKSPAFWLSVKKGKAKGAVEEFAVLNEITQASSYPEFGLPEDQDGGLKRDYEQVKLVGAIGKVSFFAKSNDMLVEAETVEAKIKTISMLKTLDVLTLHGDAAKVPTDPNGIIKQAKARMRYPTQNVIDMRGKRMRLEDLNTAGQIVADNFGNATNLKVWMSNLAYKDYTDDLIANRRAVVGVNGGMDIEEIIARASKFKLGAGAGDIESDIFLKHRGETYLGRTYPKLNSAGNALASMSASAPHVLSAQTCSLAQADDTSGNNYLAAATYDYCIVPANRFGAGVGFEIKNTQVLANKKVVFTIADNGSPTGYEATKFDIYRKLSSKTALSDYQFLFSVAANAASIVDDGYYVPGTSTVIAFDWDFDQVFTVDQLLPMVKLPLAIIGDYKWWLQKIYFTPKVFNGSKIVLFENVGSTAWA